jgi:hypothetical protein
MLIFKYLHILAMFSAVGSIIGTETLLHRVARSGDVRAMRTAFALARPMNVITPVLFLIGVALGILAAITGGLDLLAPWLLIAYVLFAVMFALGGAVQGRWLERIAAAAAVSDNAHPSPELQRLIHDRAALTAMYVGWILLVAIIFLMVVKPFS